MAKPNYSYEKRQRELARKKKQEEKRQRHAQRKSSDPASDEPSKDAIDPEEEGDNPPARTTDAGGEDTA